MYKSALCALPIMFAAAGPVVAAPDKTPQEVLHALIDSSDSAYLTQSEQNLMMMQDDPAYWIAE